MHKIKYHTKKNYKPALSSNLNHSTQIPQFCSVIPAAIVKINSKLVPITATVKSHCKGV